LKPLKDANEISDIKYEEARTDLEGAEAEREMATAKLSVVQAGTRPENIAQAEAHLRPRRWMSGRRNWPSTFA